MNGFRLTNDSHTLSFDSTLPANAERVWWHLTDCAGLRSWLADGHLEQRLGGSVTLRFRGEEPLLRTSGAGQVRGVISCYEPRRRLAYSWQDPAEHDGRSGKLGSVTGISRLTFNLTRGQGRTLLSLTHTGLPAQMLSKAGAGWPMHLGLLTNVLSEDVDGIVATQHASFIRRDSYVESYIPGMRA